jgi:hypothetical protein
MLGSFIFWIVVLLAGMTVAMFAGYYRGGGRKAVANSLTAMHLTLLIVAGYLLF